MNQSKGGSWTVDGPMEITKIELAPDKLRVKGLRVVLVYDRASQEFVAEREKRPDSVQAEILLDSALNDVAQAEALLAKVFVGSGKEIASSLPDYWQRFFENQHASEKAIDGTSSSAAAERPSRSSASSAVEDDAVVMKVGDGVHAPKPIYTPEPQYSVPAKDLKIQGVCVLKAIIDKEGKVTKPELVTPLGAGLDEQAIAAIQKWKFKPATRNGQPVSVQMGLEMSFNFF
jgi:TonB family protein